MLESITRLIALKNDSQGVTAIEYALIASLVAVVLISALGILGSDIASSFTYIDSKIVTHN